MKLENMPKANEIVDRIQHCKAQIEKWKEASKLTNEFEVIGTKTTWEHNISTKHIPFSMIRVISIDGFTKELADLEKQLEAL